MSCVTVSECSLLKGQRDGDGGLCKGWEGGVRVGMSRGQRAWPTSFPSTDLPKFAPYCLGHCRSIRSRVIIPSALV